MRYFKVVDLKNSQHYRNRNPPWIKLHIRGEFSVFDWYKFSCLQDASKLHLILLRGLASQLNNRIPEDISWLKMKMGLTGNVDLKALEDNGFIEFDSDPLADGQQVARLEGYKQEGYKQEKEKPIAHPKPDAPTTREEFEDIWQRYPQKLGKEKAFLKYKNQVKTEQDWIDIQTALVNYVADVERIRVNGQPDLRWQYGSTWFNHNWRDYVNYKPPARDGDGIDWDNLPESEE